MKTVNHATRFPRRPMLFGLCLIAAVLFANHQLHGAPPCPAPPPYPYPLDADGWMVLKPGFGAQQVYVSSSFGDDGNFGTADNPLKTIAAAMKRMRPGQADWIYLMNGDSFNEIIMGPIAGSGPHAHAVITSYGNPNLPRPKITVKGSAQLQLSGSNIAVIDLEFDAGRDPSLPGFRLITSHAGGVLFRGNNIILEGCKIVWSSSNLDFEPPPKVTTPLTGIFVRRNIIAFAYSGGRSFSQGIHTDGLESPVFEENFVHQNGWNPNVPLGTNPMFNHGMYNSWNVGARNAYFRWNIFSNNCSSGVQQRAGGVFHNNLMLNNGTAGDWTGSGESLYVDQNVSTTSLDCPTSIGPGSKSFYAGGGFQFNAFSGYLINNIVCHGRPDANSPAYQVSRTPRDVAAVIPAADVVEVAGNVTYDYYNDSLTYFSPEHPNVNYHDNITALCHRKCANFRPNVFPPATALAGKILLANNLYDVDGKFYWMDANMDVAGWSAKMHATGEKIGTAKFVDPSRTIEGYIISQKMGKNFSDFVALALQQRKGHYDKRLVAYSVNQWIQEGFKIAPSQPATKPTTAPETKATK